MATRKKKAASKGGAKRWEGFTPEQRAEKMRELAAARHAAPKLTPALLDTLQYVHDNRGVIALMVDAMLDRAKSDGVTDLNPDIQHLAEQTRDAVSESLDAAANDPEPNLIVRDLAIEMGDGWVSAAEIETVQSDALLCSVCLSPIDDLDKPCTVCVAAGRLPASPGQNPQRDFEQLANARNQPVTPAPAAEISADELAVYERVKARMAGAPAPPPPRAAVPTVGNSINRAPLPDPVPTGRHTHRDTCNDCGRLADLHQDHGGPLQHNFTPLPPEPK